MPTVSPAIEAEWARTRAHLRLAYNHANKVGGVPAWERVLGQCTLATELFERVGYPDWWHQVERFADDARIQIRHASREWGF